MTTTHSTSHPVFTQRHGDQAEVRLYAFVNRGMDMFNPNSNYETDIGMRRWNGS